jgi:predicted AlkP superfamily pyrophosphatase or phosphodiesterase
MTLLVFAGSVSLLACHWVDAAGQEPVKHVVLISIDGLAASYLDDPRADLPTLQMLAKQGASAQGMVTAFPSVTWPAH